MADSQIRYDLLMQDAMRGVIRAVLAKVAENGLPGDHHFYIVFDTTAEGVEISPRIRAQYPEEMTIVLQHQFWGLKVTNDSFEVQLSFNNQLEHLKVPFTAVRGFIDPSVSYGFHIGGSDPQKSPNHLNMLVPTESLDVPDNATGLSMTPLERPRQDAADQPPAIQVTGTDAEKGSAEIVELSQFRKK